MSAATGLVLLVHFAGGWVFDFSFCGLYFWLAGYDADMSLLIRSGRTKTTFDDSQLHNFSSTLTVIGLAFVYMITIVDDSSATQSFAIYYNEPMDWTLNSKITCDLTLP